MELIVHENKKSYLVPHLLSIHSQLHLNPSNSPQQLFKICRTSPYFESTTMLSWKSGLFPNLQLGQHQFPCRIWPTWALTKRKCRKPCRPLAIRQIRRLLSTGSFGRSCRLVNDVLWTGNWVMDDFVGPQKSKKRFGSSSQLIGFPIKIQVVKGGNRWSAVEQAILFAYLERVGTWRRANDHMMGQKKVVVFFCCQQLWSQ